MLKLLCAMYALLPVSAVRVYHVIYSTRILEQCVCVCELFLYHHINGDTARSILIGQKPSIIFA